MKIINEQRFAELTASGEIVQSDCEFLDGIKIGLRVRPKGRVLPSMVHFDRPVPTESADLDSQLQPNKLYLAETVEKLGISSRIFGLIHTRSRFARVGLDAVGSSTYVAPGFGLPLSKSLVLEIRCSNQIAGLPLNTPVAGLLLFELDERVRVGAGSSDFPFIGPEG